MTTTPSTVRSPLIRLLDPAATAAWDALVQAVASYSPPCRTDPDAWYSPNLDVTAAAARACNACHALAQCEAYADLAGEQHGVWAGVDRTRRRRTVPTEVVS